MLRCFIGKVGIDTGYVAVIVFVSKRVAAWLIQLFKSKTA